MNENITKFNERLKKKEGLTAEIDLLDWFFKTMDNCGLKQVCVYENGAHIMKLVDK